MSEQELASRGMAVMDKMVLLANLIEVRGAANHTLCQSLRDVIKSLEEECKFCNPSLNDPAYKHGYYDACSSTLADLQDMVKEDSDPWLSNWVYGIDYAKVSLCRWLHTRLCEK